MARIFVKVSCSPKMSVFVDIQTDFSLSKRYSCCFCHNKEIRLTLFDQKPTIQCMHLPKKDVKRTNFQIFGLTSKMGKMVIYPFCTILKDAI